MISVCMATYNGEKFIKQQLDSILKQLSEEDELIISDDGSTDRTLDIVNSYSDNRIKVFYNDGKCYTKNFENALRNSKGEYVFLADQDDVWKDNKIDLTKEYLKKYDFVYSDAEIVDTNMKVIQSSRNDFFHIKKGFYRNLLKTYYIGCCMAFKREVLKKALPFPKNTDYCRHDAWISLIAEKYFKTYVVKEQLIFYRRHDKNASSGAEGITNSISRMIKLRLYLLWEVLKRKLI